MILNNEIFRFMLMRMIDFLLPAKKDFVVFSKEVAEGLAISALSMR